MSLMIPTGPPRRDVWPRGVHVCHVCATRFATEAPYPRRADVPGCPGCGAPVRHWRMEDDTTSPHFFLVYTLAGAPYGVLEDTFAEFAVLQHVRTYSDIDAFLDDVRAEASMLYSRTERDQASLPESLKGDERKHAALVRLCGQLESGQLERRIDELRERTAALLRAEFEHHGYVHAARRGALSPHSNDLGGVRCGDS